MSAKDKAPKQAGKQAAKPEAEAADAAPAGKRKKPLLLIAASAVLAVAALAGGAYLALGADALKLFGGGEDVAAEHGGGHGEAEETADAGHERPANYIAEPFDEIIVNISSTSPTGRITTRFLKLNLAMVLNTEEAGATELAGRKAFIRDAYIEYLRQLNETDLKGSAGLARLKSDLLLRARVIGETDAPSEILIADLVIQ